LREKQNNKKILILFISLCFLINFLIPSSNLQNNRFNDEIKGVFDNPNVAATPSPLPYSAISQNSTSIYRLFESINFTIDTSSYSGEANYTIMQVMFTNGSLINYTQNFVGDFKFYYEFKPTYEAPLGFQNVSFLIYNVSGVLLNNHTTYTNFTIKTNYMANFNQNEYIIGDTLSADLALNDFGAYHFQWNITVVDNINESTQKNLLNLENNLYHFSFNIDNNTFQQINKIYYLKVNISNNITNKIRAAYFPFRIGNSNPLINSTLKLTPEEVFRTDECEISLNVTDLETASEDLNLVMYLYDSEGELTLELPIPYVSNNSFSETFNIPYNKPIGVYRVNITATDENGGSTSKITTLTVKNNLPEIHSYLINGISMNQSISIAYGKNLVFTFNVSDVEGVAFVKVALLNKNDEWYNITKTYDGINTEITIRTVELITGSWIVYLYVYDSDGAIISLTDGFNQAPQEIRIIADIISDFIPWISLFIGLSIGILIGIGSIFKYAKSKYRSSTVRTQKKPQIPSKKALKKKAIKPKPKQIPVDLDEVTISESETEKDQEKERVTKRKIKRKL